MKTTLGALTLVVLWFCLTTGCDSGRVGMYHVKFERANRVEGAHVVQAPTNAFLEVLSTTLEQRGFEKLSGELGRWYKDGAWVEVIRDAENRIILKTHAFGGRREIRLSKKIEQELVDLLQQKHGFILVPMLSKSE